jgi:hypothetical protein
VLPLLPVYCYLRAAAALQQQQLQQQVAGLMLGLALVLV